MMGARSSLARRGTSWRATRTLDRPGDGDSALVGPRTDLARPRRKDRSAPAVDAEEAG